MVYRFAVSFAIVLTIAPAAIAQVVQLPSIETFSYSGSVLVPDGGTTSLGSVSRSSSFSSRSPGGYSRSSSASHSGLSASVHIIDLDEMDRQIRGVDQQMSSKPRGLDLRQSASSLPKAAAPTKESQAKALVRLARRYLSEGDRIRAKLTYQRAIGDLEGDLKEYAIAEYRSVFLPY
jgi:hypothetical protein